MIIDPSAIGMRFIYTTFESTSGGNHSGRIYIKDKDGNILSESGPTGYNPHNKESIIIPEGAVLFEIKAGIDFPISDIYIENI